MTERPKRPIFLVGSGRSGSSFFARVFSAHPALSYLTRVSDRFPRTPVYNRLVLRASGIPGLRRAVRRECPIHEAYSFWDEYAPGFSQPERDLVAGDVTVRAKQAVRESVRANLAPGRPRFLAKITGWSRIGFLDEIFPDGLFVHLVRDGRDVANSFLNYPFWQGWQGPHNWRFGKLPEDLRREWEGHDRSFVALAGLCWKLLVDSVHRASRDLSPSRVREVRYEDFVSSPVEVLQQVLDHCDLEHSPGVWDELSREEIHDATGKYRRDLTSEQQKIVEQVTEPVRERYGYT